MKEIYNTYILREGNSGTLNLPEELFATCRVRFFMFLQLRRDLNFEGGVDDIDRKFIENGELESVA
jgi:hypothetical protein